MVLKAFVPIGLMIILCGARSTYGLPPPTGERCNGGTCSYTDVQGHSVVLSCPNSGGPVCGEGQACQCRCIETVQNSWSATNACITAPLGLQAALQSDSDSASWLRSPIPESSATATR